MSTNRIHGGELDPARVLLLYGQLLQASFFLLAPPPPPPPPPLERHSRAQWPSLPQLLHAPLRLVPREDMAAMLN